MNAVDLSKRSSRLSRSKAHPDSFRVLKCKPSVTSCSSSVFGLEFIKGGATTNAEKMSPRPSGSVIREGVFANAVLGANVYEQMARNIIATDADDVRILEQCGADILASEAVSASPISAIHISDIVFSVANPEMIRIYAKAIIARMQNETTARDLAFMIFERKAVGELLRSNATGSEQAITFVVSASRPDPATLPVN